MPVGVFLISNRNRLPGRSQSIIAGNGVKYLVILWICRVRLCRNSGRERLASSDAPCRLSICPDQRNRMRSRGLNSSPWPGRGNRIDNAVRDPITLCKNTRYCYRISNGPSFGRDGHGRWGSVEEERSLFLDHRSGGVADGLFRTVGVVFLSDGLQRELSTLAKE